MTEELKPCPFCGGKAMYATYKKFKYIRCRNCNSVSDFYKTIKESENAWNKRPSPWHTGTPTENGWYLVATENLEKPYPYGVAQWHDGYGWGGLGASNISFRDIFAWQKIKLSKETE